MISPDKLKSTARPMQLAVAAAALFVGLHLTRDMVRARAAAARAELRSLKALREVALSTLSERSLQRDLRNADFLQVKSGIKGALMSRRTEYETGISLQEELRLLESQWDILTTSLEIDPERRKVYIARDGKSLEGFQADWVPPKAFGGVPLKALPAAARIISKERFANPERGTSEMVDGQLIYNPPQVGSSARVNALGEYVMFAQGGLILHGPSLKRAEHDAFPHHCLGLSKEAARKLYRACFIGTQLHLKSTIPSFTGRLGGGMR